MIAAHLDFNARFPFFPGANPLKIERRDNGSFSAGQTAYGYGWWAAEEYIEPVRRFVCGAGNAARDAQPA